MAGHDSLAATSRELAEERLLIEAAQRDSAEFAELYEKYFYLIYSYVVRRVANRQAAEDVTATVFHKALEHLPRFTWRGVPFGVWLVKIAANVLADQRQRAGREQVADGVESFDYSEVRDSGESTQQILEETEESAILFQMVDQLPNDQRRVIVLRFAYEKSIAEIAKELERSEGAIKQLQFRGLENLRERLNRQRGEEDA